MMKLSLKNLLILALSVITMEGNGADVAPTIAKGDKKLPLPGESIRFNDHDAFLILPPEATESQPWVWYAPTLPGLPGTAENWLFEKFLAEGIAIAGIDVGESYGSPTGRKTFTEFHDYLVGKRGFSAKPCLLARSRGGLMLYNWAVEHPGKVSGIAGIYPVCNIISYPGVAPAAGAYQLTPETFEEVLPQHNPIDRLKPLAEADVPLFHLHGDKDGTVPLEMNSGKLAERYRKLGGRIELKIVAGGGHDMAPGWFQSREMADFIIACTKGRPASDE